jgi:uncharacterized pyridoxamine 5'-phosphate oxidase family protein
MNKIFSLMISLFFIFLFKDALSQTIIFEDNFNGNNSISDLQARGWTVINADGGGTSSAWFQGNSAVFIAAEGPDTGYVAGNYNGRNSSGTIDQWLISPSFNLSPGDSLHFWARTASGFFNDSISVYFTTATNPTTTDFIPIVGFPYTVLDTLWRPFSIIINSSSTYKFAIRYNMNDAGNTADYIGIDLFQVFSNTLPYPSSITLNNNFSFNDLTQSSYRMIGLPGNQTTKISSLITGTQKKDWDAFYDNGATTDFLEEDDGNFSFTAGKGFWVLSKNAFSVNENVNTVTLAADNTFSITLHSGFNIISNPFDKSVSWAVIQNLNGLSSNDVLHDWTGVWSDATQMEPYKGYYFKRPSNITSLKIPYNFSTSKISTGNNVKFYTGDFIKLSLVQNKQVKSYTVAGFSSSAKEDYDKLDYFAPPGYFDQIRINIEDQKISDPYKQLSVDYRPGINEGQAFDLKIKNTTKKTVRLIADGINNFENYEVYLLDKNLNKFYNLKKQSEIELSPVHKKYDYQLLIGNEKYINNIKKENVPTEYAMYQNYPNPFNPVTLIKYQIPDDNTFVELKVFNILGKEVKVLVNEVRDAGLHEVEFNASDMSSGVYFYTLKAGSYSATKKMIFMK